MPDVIHKIIHRLTVAYLIGIVPFGILNFINGDTLIGSLIAVICCNLVYIDASMHRKKTYNSTIAFGVLMPIVYFLLYQLVIDKGIVGILWCFPTILIVNFIMPQRQAVIANILTLGILTPAILTQFDMAVVIRMYASLIIVAALANLFVNIITEQHLKLSELAVKDPLTGLLNRLTLEDNITLAIQQHNRTLNPITLVSIDIDHFKLINDKYGHDAGDQVIIEIATLLKQRSRSVDQVYRLGGEEFLVILLNTDLKNAQSFSSSVQEKLTEINFEHGLTPTLSIGLAEIEKDKSWNECLKQADDNLYLAKNNGRNTIIG